MSFYSNDSLAYINQESANFFKRKFFYLNSAKLVKQALVNHVEQRGLRRERLPACASCGQRERAATVLFLRRGNIVARRFTCRRRANSFGLFREHIQLITLKPPQHLARPRQHGRGQTGQARDLYAVRLRRAPALDPVEEDDFAFTFGDAYLVVLRAGQTLGQLGQLVIVRGEQSLGRVRRRVVQMLGDGPSD